MNRKERPFNDTLPRTLHDLFVADLSAAMDVATGLPVMSPWAQSAKFKVDYLRDMYLSKLLTPDKAETASRRSLAIDKFRLMEERNLRTNARLSFQEANLGRFTTRQLTTKIRAVVKHVLGDVPLLSDIQTSGLDGMFTNGASTRIKRGPVSIAQKFVGKADTTIEAKHLFQEEILPESPLWTNHYVNGQFGFNVVGGSVMFTVPKNSVIDRVACKEPEINMYLQRGLGNHIRRRLRDVVRIDLNDQSHNQRLARLGSMSTLGHSYATIDLSSASDLISRELVRAFVPSEWFEILDQCRSKWIDIDGTQHRTEMFSSMGNGFTFELESLLFYAIAKSTCYLTGTRGRISVYGDDIIVPNSVAGLLSKIFSWYGFILNRKKSFWSGEFRESCGRHYFGGCDVTPFFIRKRIETLRDLILVLNQLRHWGTHEDVSIHLYSSVFSAVWSKYSVLVPHFLHGGKDCMSNTSLVSPVAPRRQLARQKRQIFADQTGALLHWLRGRDEAPESEAFVVSSGIVESHTVIRRNRDWERTLPVSLHWWEEIFS